VEFDALRLSATADPRQMTNISRWRATWTGLGAETPDEHLFGQVMARYSEAHRYYHTTQHLEECFARLDEARSFADHFHEVELAVWFHDAVYEVRRQDNEDRSASWAVSAATKTGLPSTVIERVRELILATKHNAAPTTQDAALLVDVDLAILGAPVERFDEYERQVRDEYAWVPGFLFRSKRREILESFLSRPYVYTTDHFRASLESTARGNLARSIRQLGG
jgi:predicted metal-dependent HD superfamily phosphohydrolase